MTQSRCIQIQHVQEARQASTERGLWTSDERDVCEVEAPVINKPGY